MYAMKVNSQTLPPIPPKTGPGRRNRSGPVPVWGLRLGGFLTTVGIFAGSFGYADTHLYVTNAPLQPATAAAVGTATSTAASASATTAPSTASTSTTTLTSRVRTTTRTAVTTTQSS
jgi:hypothetical protein